MSDRPEVASVSLEELKESVELQRITFFEVSARKWNSDLNKKDEVPSGLNSNLAVMNKIEEHSIAVRCRLTLSNEEGVVTVDAAAVFQELDQSTESETIGISEDVLIAFNEQVGIPIVYPYLREASQEAARKLRLKVPMLRVLWPGTLKRDVKSGDCD